MSMKKFVAFVFVLAHLMVGVVFAAAPLLVLPDYHAHVTDLAHVLPYAEQQLLEKELIAFEAQHGAQIGVLIVGSTQPEDITDYTQRVAEHWKLGRQGIGDGLLLVVATKDRRVRIAPYRALESAIPDVLAKRIIDTQMAPAFRQGQYATGLREALQSLQQAILGGGGLEMANPDTFQQKWWSQIKKWGTDALFGLLLAFWFYVIFSLIRNYLSRFLWPLPAALTTALLAGALCYWFSANKWLSALFMVLGYFCRAKIQTIKQSGKGGNQPFSLNIGSGAGSGTRSGGGGDSAGGGASGRW